METHSLQRDVQEQIRQEIRMGTIRVVPAPGGRIRIVPAVPDPCEPSPRPLEADRRILRLGVPSC